MGKNLFKPGSTPSQNMQFLLFLAAFVEGVDEYQGLLRASIASSGNDHRLGAQEAPPAILSIFLGDELTEVVESIIAGTNHQDAGKRLLSVGVDVLPLIRQDNTDRNRTSPIAFTGNKFEFRMPGSSDSLACPNVMINTVMAEELSRYADELEDAEDVESAVAALLKRVFTAHQRILFEGNGYDAAWVEEAEKRGLLNLQTTPDALPQLHAPASVALLVKHGIYEPEEIEARYNVYVDKYVQEVRIEARTMLDMIGKDILPAVSGYAAGLCHRAAKQMACGVSAAYEKETAEKILALMTSLQESADSLEKDLAAMPEDMEEAMYYCRDTLIGDMSGARAAADALEPLVDRKVWPFPTYADLMFSER
jgi:glutamine synthetase